MIKINEQGKQNLDLLKQWNINVDALMNQLNKNITQYTEDNINKLNNFINLDFEDNKSFKVQTFEILSYDASEKTFEKLTNIWNKNFDDYKNQKDEYMSDYSIMLGFQFKDELDRDLKQNGIETKYSYVFNAILNCDDDTYYNLNDAVNELNKEDWFDFQMELLDNLLNEVKENSKEQKLENNNAQGIKM
ncbi:Uncharacterised protein [Mycoplasmopsis citelli]|uniref:Uncharacterized protein n=1 Tax=Mycoplasmopsis citelli TaxID=171281 RepID=A0A449B115_9BACT|nr:hypothetical protein [Mycoplasmopsis citelli]VEU74292.1 Uncharacterised protein [Mycoplasmopsis citelli]